MMHFLQQQPSKIAVFISTTICQLNPLSTILFGEFDEEKLWP